MNKLETMPPTHTTDDTPQIVLAHGGGGELTAQLIARHFLPALDTEHLRRLADSAVVPWSADNVVFTTDSYVVTPLEFPGGDIGRIAVAGTVNDIAVMGAEPAALSLGLIIEEGLAVERLDRIIASIAAAAKEAGIEIVTGDTKVIERRRGDGLFINTAGIGRRLPRARLDLEYVAPGDVVLFSGNLAEHGLTIMAARGGLEFETSLRSDAAPLNGLVHDLIASGADVRFLRDATRGGLAGVLTDLSDGCGLSVEIDEDRLPISPTARHAAEMLGLDPLTVANEGKLVCVVAADDAETALRVMQATHVGSRAAIIGRMTDAAPPLVQLNTSAGGQRIVQRPYGEELPRIC